MKSKKQLFKDIAEIQPTRFMDAPQKGLGHEYIDDETYGKNSMIYIHVLPDTRKDVENTLEKMGHKVCKSYEPSQIVEVQVDYFKGWHWDE